MQEKPSEAAERALMDALPEDSRATLKELKALITDLGEEAVRLGQLTPEAYERNKMAYLNRSYQKHVLDDAGQISKFFRAKSLAVRGNQYKGRGIFDQVDAIPGANKGDKVSRVERRDKNGKLHAVKYVPAAALPQYAGWVRAGEFEVRSAGGKKMTVWRDFTKAERERMGEIDEVRYAVAQTLQMMVHDIETGRFFEWVADEYGKDKPEGEVAETVESLATSFRKDVWVHVPDVNIKGTQTKKYGALSGKYVPGPVWNDIRQAHGWKPTSEFGRAHEKVLQFWKKSKTAWSPGVHMNNVMANFVIADWHDLRSVDLAEALMVWAKNKQPGYKEIYQRFEDSGAMGGMFLSNEVLRDEIAKQLDSLKDDLKDEALEKSNMARVMHLFTMAGMVPKKYAQGMEAAYQFEDAIFRLAAFTKAIRYGKTDVEAGKIARDSFLNYDINAPWIQAARHTGLPFISFFYRALPMAINTVKAKPWKILKLMGFWHLVSALGYMMSGGDEEEERDLLPKEKQGNVWGVVPKMVRMPWNGEDDAPVFLDIRRWVPVGDIADMEMGSGMLPPWATPSGPMLLMSEVLLMNKSMFTEKEIVTDTDSQREKLEKRLDHLFKGMMPNVPLPNPLNLQTPAGEINPFDLNQGSMQSYAWSGIERSQLKQAGSIGEIRSTPAAIANTLGIKVSAYPAENMSAAKDLDYRRSVMGVKAEMKRLQRNFANLNEPTKQEEGRFDRAMERQREKLDELEEKR